MTHAPPRPSHTKHPTLTRRISFPSLPLADSHLALVRRWVTSFALVDFDIDQGPNLDNAYPPARFPDPVTANVAFSSMPEATSLPPPDDLPDAGYAYHWRIPYPDDDALNRFEDPAAAGHAHKRLLRLPHGDGADGALHGFVWFVRDKVPSLCLSFVMRAQAWSG